MSRFFYSRLAVTNLRKNGSIYLPYLLSGALMTALFYILRSVETMVSQSEMYGGWQMGIILQLSSVICGILSLVILFYINSFVMKRRKREFGLYSILGMEKRHISIVLLWEVGITSAICILSGVLGGALLSQLMFLLLLRIIKLPVELTFQVPVSDVAVTIALFLGGFLIVLAYDICAVLRSDPISLLHGSNVGEREPKSRRLLAVLGLLALGGGYAVAMLVRTPSEAIMLFFFAVLLVIVGTYLLFVTGSIVLLKALRKNKRFYYQPENFISVSGMLYRMKQNAAGLANICILSTCVLVTLSSTVSLFIGEEDILKQRYPRQVHVNCIAAPDSAPLVARAAGEHASRHQLTVRDAEGYYSFDAPVARQDGKFTVQPYYTNETYGINCITLEDYNRMAGLRETLEPGEALVSVYGDPLEEGTLRLGEQSFRIKGGVTVPELVEVNTATYHLVVVLPTLDSLYAVKADADALGHERKHNVWYDYHYNVAGDKEQLSGFYASMGDFYKGAVPRVGLVDNVENARQEFYQVYGSMLFVGIFFISLFLIATVLIIYYKQITEGFEDHDRFQIMQRVGMSDHEVRATIRKQVLLVFFLPLGMAVLHIAVAFRVLCILLTAFGMTNVPLFLLCMGCTVLLFSALYYFVYRLTARTYYRIVQSRA